MEKKIYEEPTVAKVEFDFSARMAISGLSCVDSTADPLDDDYCLDAYLFNL